jgi:sugar phosphate isomerase/epimerase
LLIGVHSHLFRGSLMEIAKAAATCRLDCVELTPNFPGLGFQHPCDVTPERARRVAQVFGEAGVRIASVAAATMLLDPDLKRRHAGIVRSYAIIRYCRDFGSPYAVVQVGAWPGIDNSRSFDTDSASWQELVAILAGVVDWASEWGVQVLLKPGAGDLFCRPGQAQALRDRLPGLHFVMDPAVLLSEESVSNQHDAMRALMETVGPWSPIFHAKDLLSSDHGWTTPPAGRGRLDYAELVRLYGQHQHRSAIIMEHVRPQEIEATRVYIQRCLAEAESERGNPEGPVSLEPS